MKQTAILRYFGWSALSVETADGIFLFDPFYRTYCGDDWFSAAGFKKADYIAVTHGHEEHFLDVPEIARRTGARVIGPESITRFLRKRNHIRSEQLITLNAGQSIDLSGFRVDAFGWQHRDINLYKALTKAVFQGNATQLSWAWHSVTQAPFAAPYTGYRLTLPDGLTVLNYNEGFNSKMSDVEIRELGDGASTDVLLGGMQLDFIDDLHRGVKALNPKLILLYPPHEKFHDLMGVKSRPWSEFVAAAQGAAPAAKVVVLAPGTQVDLTDGSVTHFERAGIGTAEPVADQRESTLAA
ncbi:MAG: hypothetical protein A3K04_04885 [Gallionellales bacterium RBG_16_56_9]|nr:MAG: hypothetical protein A3K04_04885 [Gallionellales bacterium RBG_16_56_9]